MLGRRPGERYNQINTESGRYTFISAILASWISLRLCDAINIVRGCHLKHFLKFIFNFWAQQVGSCVLELIIGFAVLPDFVFTFLIVQYLYEWLYTSAIFISIFYCGWPLLTYNKKNILPCNIFNSKDVTPRYNFLVYIIKIWTCA